MTGSGPPPIEGASKDVLFGTTDPALRAAPLLERALSTVRAYAPHDAAQAATRERMLAFAREHPDALHRSCRAGHFTASALVVDAPRRRALLTLHAKLGRWLQLGGHCDGDGNLAAVALREAIEESGIPDLVIDPRPLDLDVHVIPARPGEPEHLHLDTRFRVVAPPGAVPVASAESHALRWFRPEELRSAAVESDASVARLFRLALGA